MRVNVAALLAIVSLAGGCQRSDGHGMMGPLHRAIARHDVARGCDRSAAGDEAAAAALLESAVAHDPHNALGQANLGRIRATAGQYEEAVRHYQAAVRNAPETSEYAFALANCLDKLAETSIDRQQMLDRAIRAYRYVLFLDPHNLEAEIRLGACCRRQGDFVEAFAALRRAETPDSPSARIHNELASTYEDLGDYDKALSEYAQSLQLEPDNLIAHNGCGEINLALSRRPSSQHPLARRRAIAHLRRSLEIEAGQPRVRALLAELEPSAREMADAGE
jgi:tetratricopeptide (TPR) repeat protein